MRDRTLPRRCSWPPVRFAPASPNATPTPSAGPHVVHDRAARTAGPLPEATRGGRTGPGAEKIPAPQSSSSGSCVVLLVVAAEHFGGQRFQPQGLEGDRGLAVLA